MCAPPWRREPHPRWEIFSEGCFVCCVLLIPTLRDTRYSIRLQQHLECTYNTVAVREQHRSIRVCLNPPPESMGTSGTERGCSWSFVPFLSKKTCSGPCRILGPASRIGTNGIFCTCHGKLLPTSIFGGVRLHQIICYLFPIGWAVRSSQTRKRGATRLLPLPRYTVFLGLH